MRQQREMGAKLGDLLASRGKLDREVLLRALRHQRASGGRLGTCLLELDAVAEDDLLHVLSDQLKVPFVDADELRSVAADVLRLIPVKIASKHCAVPVRGSGSQLSVAMLDPLDLAALDELSFVSGRRVRPHTALEVRLQEALARHYRVDIPSRFVQLLDRLNRRSVWKREDAAAATEASAASPAPARPAEPAPPASPYPEPPPLPGAPPPVAPPLPGYAATSPPTPVLAAPPPRTGPVAPAARPALGFEEAEARLARPADRDAVAETLIEYLTGRVDAGLTLMVRRDEAAGWRGCGLPHEVASAVRISLADPSVVRALREGAPLHRGALGPLRGNASLIAALGADSSDLLALPLRLRGRLVAVLIAMMRRGALEAGLVDDLQRLAAKASGALEILVMRHKLEQA